MKTPQATLEDLEAVYLLLKSMMARLFTQQIYGIREQYLKNFIKAIMSNLSDIKRGTKSLLVFYINSECKKNKQDFTPAYPF